MNVQLAKEFQKMLGWRTDRFVKSLTSMSQTMIENYGEDTVMFNNFNREICIAFAKMPKILEP